MQGADLLKEMLCRTIVWPTTTRVMPEAVERVTVRWGTGARRQAAAMTVVSGRARLVTHGPSAPTALRHRRAADAIGEVRRCAEHPVTALLCNGTPAGMRVGPGTLRGLSVAGGQSGETVSVRRRSVHGLRSVSTSRRFPRT